MQRKEKDIGEIRTVCQTEVGHISVPEEYERREEIQELLIRVVDSRRFHAEDMELLLGELQQMCGYIQARLLGIQEAAEAAEQARSQAQERLNRAEQLQQAYQQLEEAETVLQQCKENAGEMQRLEQQIRIIRNAWEIFDCFELVQTNEKIRRTDRDRTEKVWKSGCRSWYSRLKKAQSWK